MDSFKLILDNIISDSENSSFIKMGYKPLYSANKNAKILIVGQAPGQKAQQRAKVWDDKSGDTLREWLGVDKEVFYSDSFSFLPADFFYQGRAKNGDLPPRKWFAKKYHSRLIELMPNIKLTIPVGLYAQKEYLLSTSKANLTQNVKSFREFLPKYFPLVHPSPLNFRWQSKNPWFLDEVVPILKKEVKNILNAT